jgi:glyoxylase-like metal-dependent hydrolase (beta-lactamase superfamily II)
MLRNRSATIPVPLRPIMIGLAIGIAIQASPPVRAQTPALERQQVSERVWMLSGRGGNTSVVVTGEGVIVIDTKYSASAPEIVAQIRQITDQPIRFIINTHLHGDHVGGNAALQEHGPVIAHRNTYERMKHIEAPEAALPRIVFDREMTLRLGDTEIRLLHRGRAHTDTDVAVWLPGENVLVTGDLFFNRITPYVDRENGAHTAGWIEFINTLVQLGDRDTKVVPGHGELSDLDGFRAMSRYLQAVRAVVQRAHDEGRSKEEIVALTLADLGEEFTDWQGSRVGMALSAAWDELIGKGTAP